MNLLLEVMTKNLSSSDDCVRLFHGRGKKWNQLEHICIDYFKPSVLITTYKEIGESEKLSIINTIQAIPNFICSSIILQKRYLKNDNTELLFGQWPLESYALECGESYGLNLQTPQNTGFFLDMAIGRQWLRKNSQAKKILNLFSYTCSLSVAALKGGATEVINVDMSRAALSVGQKNHDRNGLAIEVRKAKFIHYDIMKSLGTLAKKGPYDLVIIDPPTNQGASFKVERDYHKIVRRLSEMTSENAIVMACLNSPYLESSFLLQIFAEHAPMFTLQEKHFSSFSEMELNPEEGLKILFFKKC